MGKDLFVYEFLLKDGQNISENFGSCAWPFRRFLAIFLVLFVTLSFSKDVFNIDKLSVDYQLATNSTMLAGAVIEEPNFDINYAKIEETFSRRKLIYQRSCSLIKKLITLNKKGLTNEGYSL